MLADELGLHVSTVSRVLNGRYGATGAGSETVARIRRLAQERGYRPNPHATSLRTRRSHLVGVLVPRLADIVLATIYEGVEEAATALGYSTFVTNSRDEPELQRAKTEMMLSRRVDGMVFGDARSDARFVDELAARGVPFVLTNRRAGDHPSATCDDYDGGRQVARHLLELGHERVAVLAGEPYASTGIDRTRGCLDGLREGGVDVPAAWVVHSPFDAAGGRAAAEQVLAGPERPTAVFAVNDFAAIGAMGALRDRHLQAGEDVAVVGFNDTPLARQLPIPLTSVRSPVREMGREAMQLLHRLLAGEAVQSLLLPPRLVVRASSAGHLGDPAVVEAPALTRRAGPAPAGSR
ncbi:substrate-binding domain-containing protein [Quadrisphaera sp. DSM 44207]|uniref:LacI family DNA-binding transcriptional regulator n=1 Tax=Quadrisphaera sp. DSM 44207 TaxID=1881057 RepID=UPI000B88D436